MSKLPGIKIRNIQTIVEQHGKLWHLTEHHFLTKKVESRTFVEIGRQLPNRII
jgi:hypothetical protein